MSVDDIDRARPKKDTQILIATRPALKIDDIEGTKSKSRIFYRPRDNYSSIDYNDVSAKASGSKRCTNPLMPTYTIRDEGNNVCEIGPVHGS